MKSAPELLSFCAMSGVELWAEAGRLRYRGAASVVTPILPDLQRFKPALLELLAAPEVTEPSGTAIIAACLQSYERLFQAAQRGELPEAPLGVTIGGKRRTIEAADVTEIEAEWRQRFGDCQNAARDLTTEEAAALDAATELLETVWAYWDDGEAWLDPRSIEAKLFADYRAMGQNTPTREIKRGAKQHD